MAILPAIANLSLPQLGFIFLITLSILLFYKFIIKMGIFTKLTYQKLILPQSQYLYLQYRGPFGQLNTVCDKLIDDTSKKPELKSVRMMAISYDNPADGPGFRAVVGILLEPSLKQDIEIYLKRHSDYSVKHLEKTTFIKTSIKMVSRLSFLLLPFKLYPGLKNHIKENKIQMNSFEGIVELYGMPEETIIVGAPLEKHEQFNLSIHAKKSKSQ